MPTFFLTKGKEVVKKIVGANPDEVKKMADASAESFGATTTDIVYPLAIPNARLLTHPCPHLAQVSFNLFPSPASSRHRPTPRPVLLPPSSQPRLPPASRHCPHSSVAPPSPPPHPQSRIVRLLPTTITSVAAFSLDWIRLDYVKKFPALRHLCMILKVFLHQRELNEISLSVLEIFWETPSSKRVPKPRRSTSAVEKATLKKRSVEKATLRKQPSLRKDGNDNGVSRAIAEDDTALLLTVVGSFRKEALCRLRKGSDASQMLDQEMSTCTSEGCMTMRLCRSFWIGWFHLLTSVFVFLPPSSVSFSPFVTLPGVTFC
ncbi:hypothetical protein ABZP36_035378 [Zizania latifolia]